MESYFLHPTKLAPVMTDESYSLVSAVQSQQGAVLRALKGINQQLQQLKVSVQEKSHSLGLSRLPNQYRIQQSRDCPPVICHKCKQESHYSKRLCLLWHTTARKLEASHALGQAWEKVTNNYHRSVCCKPNHCFLH